MIETWDPETAQNVPEDGVSVEDSLFSDLEFLMLLCLFLKGETGKSIQVRCIKSKIDYFFFYSTHVIKNS